MAVVALSIETVLGQTNFYTYFVSFCLEEHDMNSIRPVKEFHCSAVVLKSSYFDELSPAWNNCNSRCVKWYFLRVGD